MPLILYYGTDRIIREVPQRGHIKNFQVTDALRNCFDNVNYFRDFYDWFKTEEDIEKYLEIIPLTVIPDGNVKYGAYSNYAKGKKYYTPKK